jgi:hypothetical protein
MGFGRGSFTANFFLFIAFLPTFTSKNFGVDRIVFTKMIERVVKRPRKLNEILFRPILFEILLK